MRLVNSILLVGEGRIEGTDGKRMCLGRLVAIGPDRRIKGPQGLVIKIIQVIPEQAQIKARTLGKIERLGKVVCQFIFGVLTQLHLKYGVGKHRSKMQAAFESGEVLNGLRQCGSDFKHRQTPTRINSLHQVRE